MSCVKKHQQGEEISQERKNIYIYEEKHGQFCHQVIFTYRKEHKKKPLQFNRSVFLREVRRAPIEDDKKGLQSKI